MIKAVTDVYGRLNDGETPSSDNLASKAEEVKEHEPHQFKEGWAGPGTLNRLGCNKTCLCDQNIY